MHNKSLQNRYTEILSEKKLEHSKRNHVVGQFISYVCKELDINSAPKIHLNNDINFGSKNKTFGHFNLIDNKIVVAASNRNLADVLRTIAHELTHYKQKLENRLDNKSGETGSEIENEANAKAGVMMRSFGKLYPEIYE